MDEVKRYTTLDVRNRQGPVYAQPGDNKGLLVTPIISYDYIQSGCPSSSEYEFLLTR
jgi:hypothetical protein